jgi:anti-sigma B factor antagonist
MRVQVRFEPNVAVIELAGRALGGRDAKLFHGTVQEHLHLGGRNFVVDLGKVDRMNSTGLGMLMAAHASVRKEGGRFVIADLTRIESLLSLTRLITVLENYDTTAEAITRLQSATTAPA